VALDAGILELIGHEIREGGERLVLRHRPAKGVANEEQLVTWQRCERESL